MRPNVCNESVPNEMCLSNLLMLEMQIKALTLQCGNAVNLYDFIGGDYKESTGLFQMKSCRNVITKVFTHHTSINRGMAATLMTVIEL